MRVGEEVSEEDGVGAVTCRRNKSGLGRRLLGDESVLTLDLDTFADCDWC